MAATRRTTLQRNATPDAAREAVGDAVAMPARGRVLRACERVYASLVASGFGSTPDGSRILANLRSSLDRADASLKLARNRLLATVSNAVRSGDMDVATLVTMRDRGYFSDQGYPQNESVAQARAAVVEAMLAVDEAAQRQQGLGFAPAILAVIFFGISAIILAIGPTLRASKIATAEAESLTLEAQAAADAYREAASVAARAGQPLPALPTQNGRTPGVTNQTQGGGDSGTPWGIIAGIVAAAAALFAWRRMQ